MKPPSILLGFVGDLFVDRHDPFEAFADVRPRDWMTSVRPIEADYEDGVLRPTKPLRLRQGERVSLVVLRHRHHSNLADGSTGDLVEPGAARPARQPAGRGRLDAGSVHVLGGSAS